MRILALETSCDDTCAAVADDRRVLSNVISSQASFHERYGGVVPEVASRHHLELVNPVVDAAIDEAGVELGDVDSVAVTRGPGLIGALLVGVSTAKALAASRRKPLIGVNHLHGHVAANFLEPDPLEPPFLCLIASGGHTLLAAVREHGRFETLGQTLDDAAGEALDKAARLLDLGYPGGPAIQRLAADGDPDAFAFPVAMREGPGLDFSFSGLKTALVYAARELGEDALEARKADLAASFQAAVVGQLVGKLERGLESPRTSPSPRSRELSPPTLGAESPRTSPSPRSLERSLPMHGARTTDGWQAVALGGGVAANALLRGRVAELCERRGLRLKLVAPELCTDNAAMIAAAAGFTDPAPYPEYLSWDASAS